MNKLKQFIEDHKAAAAGLAAVLALAVILLFRRQQQNTVAASPNGDLGSSLAANVQLQTTAAQLAAQNNQTNAQVQATQIAANTQNLGTQASLVATQDQTAAELASDYIDTTAAAQVQNHSTDATVQENEDDLNYALGLQSTQNQVLEDEINGSNEVQDRATDSQTQIALTELEDATGLATNQESDYEKNVQSVLPLAGKQYNSALDANNANAEIETILSGGNPAVAGAGINSSAAAAVSGNNATASEVVGISSAASKIIGSLFG